MIIFGEGFDDLKVLKVENDGKNCVGSRNF